MAANKILSIFAVLALVLAGCSRQQSDWQKAREANSTDAYEQYLKKYPSGEFTAQAQARVKDLYEERDWQKARDTDTAEGYQAFVKQYPEGKWTEEARIRVENFTLAQPPAGVGASPGSDTAAAPGPGAPPPGSATSTPASVPAPAARTTVPATAPARASAPPASSGVPAAPSVALARSSPPISKAAEAGAPSGSFGVQLGAFKSGSAAANERWTRLQQEYPKLLSGLSSKVVPKKTGSGTLYRLQAMGVSEKHARLICKNLKAKSQACVVIKPSKV